MVLMKTTIGIQRMILQQGVLIFILTRRLKKMNESNKVMKAAENLKTYGKKKMSR